jgi:4-amino-4-deoxy-L-arabinose transferase-like glycosyltransferase
LLPKPDLDRRTALLLLAAITALAALFRFDGLAWGAPYYHFHIDEHFVLGPADSMRQSMRAAAMWPKFFMYSPLLMYLVNIGRGMYEAFGHPLDLAVPHDEVVYAVIGRAISATLGTATIPVVYAIASRIAGRFSGLLAAVLLACTVIHLRDSHFAATDVSMTFACALALWCAIRLVETGGMRWLIASGLAFAGAVLFKYSGAFVLAVIGLAYFLAPGRPAPRDSPLAWLRWAVRGTTPIFVGAAAFLLVDPLVWLYPDKFRSDIKDWVIDPLTGVTKPIWAAQFADVASTPLYWFTNLMWWGLGPALEIAGIAGVIWLLARRDKKAFLAGVYPIAYFLAAAPNNRAPFIRYILPLCPAFAVAAAVLCTDWIARAQLPIVRLAARAVTAIVIVASALYAAAYMNVFRQPDARLDASKWLVEHVPQGASVLVEPSQNTPPMGSYYTSPNFSRDNVLWANPNGRADRNDYFHLFTLDTYRFLYNPGVSDEQRQQYIDSRLPLANIMVIDDSFVQFYQHLPDATHHVTKKYYDDLFAGRLGFSLARTFKVYPALFGIPINDDAAELTFRLFDHPRVYIFMRAAS